ncbi:hypothetical protein F4553_005894 [Allocatelliglobosispora scoriae]|uniref:Uncharacterized protein n=1 Tax=Allocatelliglobosispora scoriae TaxID=643052 RepID=A0A841C0I2_9ACTN|nr:DUF6300 family protein [Allocatelliglobosispora scoriae]MBB5872460.1 hypothetical protein [Allocatelliglobosispora scoriae]
MSAVQVTVAGNRRCPRCAAKLCLTATIDQTGRAVALCPTCDAGNADAQRLLEYFTTNQTVLPQDRALVSEMLGRWLGSATRHEPAATLTERVTLADEAEAWWAARQRQQQPASA